LAGACEQGTGHSEEGIISMELLLLLKEVVVVVVVVVVVFIILLSQVFPGTFPLEPVVNPTTQASSCRL
jgi:uncharacterized protein (UPF0333 family)